MNIGIIGAGGMASYHYQGFVKAGATVVAVVDNNPLKAKVFAEKNHIANTFGSLKEMLAAMPDLDAVSVVTPNKFHKELTLEALNSGKHVYCEKPPARNASEMQEMYDAALKSGKTLLFDFNNRARAEAQALATYIGKGEVGTINSAQATWIRRAGIPGFGGWFTDKEFAGGGPVIDLLHMIDLALYFMGFPEPEYVLASTFSDFMGNPVFKGPWGIADGTGVMDVETACHAMITFTGGQCLSVRNSWAEMNEREVVSVVFQGSKAGGKIERLFERDGYDETSIDTCTLYTEEYGKQVNREILCEKDETMGRLANAMNFVQVVSQGAKPLNTPDQALRLMKITDAIYESARTNKPVRIQQEK
ncbi:putative dehydrogenase [Sphaerochaeta pleomorpha str. Grapes]|uniref:Putative dehydrogenase n=1 Tax=Sphaerochaeta pleomorpha (strain ATCC BAA-1885 / DSM 22778 / Grapes) TaxID=158190 RepID=G8QRA1_SPHPG|nr:Gfo/Idh/MocA family oxidoreductase [Sphaerochaeta pleomorpha]AEV28754.1 putative dehydrogenase [Sphaerochaeta pleomorpha str. Grapes]